MIPEYVRMGTKDLIGRCIPLCWHLPVRYFYQIARRRLDPEFLVLRSLLDGSGVAIDVGANYGTFSMCIRHAVEHIEAFEPLAAPCTVLATAPYIHSHQVALADYEGETTLYVPHTNGRAITGSASFTSLPYAHTVSVPVRRLDSFGFQNVRAIKIDVEGHEMAVLRGAQETMTRDHPILCVEIEQRHLNAPMTTEFAWLTRLGYQGFFLWHGRVKPLSAFSYVTHQAPFLLDVQNRHYIHDFLFLHSSDPRLPSFSG
jgi:FkbM family methyltransferase